eukprot:c18981_g2_i1.p1 GENE.c18981_g2_i1~~c18981_g2_i1.p1  ORF type:complete len:606 (-),score=221.17 c18981_g2_i1:28-1845(-)
MANSQQVQVPSSVTQSSGSTFSTPNSSLYVGDLHPDVTEALLFEKFSSIGPVSSIRVCRDSTTRRSLGYAYVNFHNSADAERALDMLNHTPIKGTNCRIMWSVRDPSSRKNTNSNLFVKNLLPTMDDSSLADLFSSYGTILSCKVARDLNMQSKCFGFVHFANEQHAENAINDLNGKDINGKLLYVGKFERRVDRTNGMFTNVYIKNIPVEWDEVKVRSIFDGFGVIKSFYLPTENGGQHKGFCFVDYSNHEEAKLAIEKAKEIEAQKDKFLFADRFQKRSERDSLLAKKLISRSDQYKNSNFASNSNTNSNVNLYVKNLDDDVGDDALRVMFERYGEVKSATVMKDARGTPRGFGFVTFSKREDAQKAISDLHKKIVAGTTRPLYVAQAQSREERRVQLQYQFQPNFVNGAAPYSPMFYPSFAVAPHTMVYAPPAMMPRQFQQMRVPFNNPQYNNPQQMKVMGGVTEGVYPGGRGAGVIPRYGGAGGGMGAGVGGGMQSATKYRGNQPRAYQPPITPAPIMQQNFPSSPLNGLVDAPLEKQKNILGEKLFPLIQAEQPQMAGKITGMLLEMEVSEILRIIESTQERRTKVEEAINVLRNHGITG